MKKRVVIISFFTEWVTHLGVELELMERHLRNGDDVAVLYCDSIIGACRLNPLKDRTRCERCIYRRVRGLQLLSSGVEEYALRNFIDDQSRVVASEAGRSIVTLESARRFRWKGLDLGWGAASSAIDLTRDPTGGAKQFADILPNLIESAVLSFEGVSCFLQKEGPFDIAYIFNGRFECTKGAALAVQSIGSGTVCLHERGANNSRYEIYADGPLHSRSLAGIRVKQYWSRGDADADREREGQAFFVNRRGGRPEDWISFISRQDSQRLPEGFVTGRKSIALFNSSEDELASIGDEWAERFYPSQSIAISLICRDLMERSPEWHVYLRMHPNLSGVDNADVRFLRGLSFPNLTLIEPDSDISSYGLMEVCDKVLTFGSTMGVEASYWGKCSILAGPSLYETLDCVYIATSHEDLLGLLTADLPPKPRFGAIQYGYYWGTFGVPYEFWQADGFFHGQFRGRSITPFGWFFARYANFMAAYLGARSCFLVVICAAVDFVCRLRKKVCE